MMPELRSNLIALLSGVVVGLAALGCVLCFAIAGLKRFVIPWHDSVNLVHA